MSRLEGKVAVVTGANSGIGLATARLFAREGARVFVTGRRQTELDEAARQIGANAIGVTGDVSRLADLDQLYDIVRREGGIIDILFANAGGGEFARLGEITEAQYEHTFATNVKGTLFTVQKALPLMRDGGSIILTGSTAGVMGTPAFSASKAAIRNFARSWILDLAPRRIRVNVLAPGATLTPGWHALAGSDEQLKRMVTLSESATPLGRLGTPDETAAVALFLASDESSYSRAANCSWTVARRRFEWRRAASTGARDARDWI